MSSNSLIFCHPLLLPPSIFPSIQVFSKESVLCIRWPNYWSFSFSTSSSNEYSALISFRIDWFDLLAVPGTLKNLLQHHSSKASIISCTIAQVINIKEECMWKILSLLFQSPVAFRSTPVGAYPLENTLGKVTSDFVWMIPENTFQYLAD